MDATSRAALKQKLGDKAYRMGFEYEREYGGCGQCTLLVLQDMFDMRNDAIFKALTGIAGGAGRLCDVGCGAYIGGVAFLGTLKGRTIENIKDPEDIRSQTHELVQALHTRFIEEYGTVICRDMHTRLFGRYFYMPDPEERKKFNDAGAHTTVCTDVVGKACRWVTDIIVDNALLPDEALIKAAD